ncbi:MAG: hypothetical protein U0R64_05285 [Candidatus Nanopelagicales bacterium]
MNRSPLIATGAVVLTVAGLPGVAAAAGPDQVAADAALRSVRFPREAPMLRQDSDLVNDEIVIAQLDPLGLPIDADLISRISSRPGEERTVEDPTATTNVVYLNQRGQPVVNSSGDAIELTVGGPNPSTVLTQGQVDKPLSVALHAEYRLNGEVVDPEVIVGASGDIFVTYTVTNTDVKKQKITYTDANGKEYSEKQPVFAPFVGTLMATLPPDMQLTDSRDAVVSTDKEGNTILMWNLVLYPPMGNYEQRVSFRATTTNGSVPATVLNVVPVDPNTDPSVKFTTDLFQQTVDGNEQLASGLEQLNNQTSQLAQGAAQLAGGIGQLADGTQQVSSGVSSGLVPGTQQLAQGAAQLAAGQQELATALGGAASGADQLASGGQQLATGLTSLSDGLDQYSQNFPQIVDGTQKLRDGAELLAKVVGSPTDKPLPTPTPSLPPGPTPIPTPSGTPIFPTPTPSPTRTPTLIQAMDAATKGAQQLADQTVILNNNLYRALQLLKTQNQKSAQVTDSADSASTQAQAAYDQLCVVPATPGCSDLQAALDDLDDTITSSQNVTDALTQIVGTESVESMRAYGIAQGSHELVQAMQLILGGLKLVGAGLDNDTTKSMVPALDQLVSGLEQADSAAEQLASGAGQAATGADQLSTGTDQLAGGLGQAAGGADQLAQGGAGLAQGAQALSFGTEQVASALTQLASGADQAASGANEFASGLTMFQTKGTQKIYESVAESSSKPGLATAYLEAASARAKTALPYGLPDGATGSVAYVMTMEGVSPSGASIPWELGGIGLILVAGGAGAVLKNLANQRRAK